MSKYLPCGVSTALAVSGSDPISIEVSTRINSTSTAENAPLFVQLDPANTVDVDAFAVAVASAAGNDDTATARLMINGFLEVIRSIFEDEQAHTVNTPIGTILTMVAGSLASANAALTDENYAYLSLVENAAFQKEVGKITLSIPTEACPVTLKRVRDVASAAKGIKGAANFYLEGVGMTFGSEGEKLELYKKNAAGELVKAADCTVSGHDSEINFTCAVVAPAAGLAVGTYYLRLTAKAGTDQLWPVDLKVEVLTAIAPATGPVVTGVHNEGGSGYELSLANDGIIEGSDLVVGGAMPTVKILYQQDGEGEYSQELAIDAAKLSGTASAVTIDKSAFTGLPEDITSGKVKVITSVGETATDAFDMAF